jgi:aspartate carbamoyltransferase catalytic subunit
MRNPQLNLNGALTHLLTTEGLSRAILTRILDTTTLFLTPTEGGCQNTPLLQGKKVLSLVDACLVDEASLAVGEFERAAYRLSAQWQGIQTLDFSAIAAGKGPQADIVVLRTEVSGVPHWMAPQLDSRTHIINAGDGCHAEPISALLDMHTIRLAKENFANLTVVLVGDVLHSRRARSCIHALTTLCVAEVRAVGPLTLLPEGLAQLGVRAYTDMAEGLREADVIIMLDLGHTAIARARVPSAREFVECYVLTDEKISYAKPDCLVLGTETDGVVQKLASEAVHMAVMSLVAGASV